MCEYGDVRVIAMVMCEWSGHNYERVNMECASTVMCEWSGHNVRVNMKCTSRVMSE